MIINQYPNIKKAALEIAYDNGIINRLTAEDDWLLSLDEVMAGYDQADLVSFDMWLGTLSDEDFNVVATGDQDEAENIEKTFTVPYGGPDNQPLTRMLEDIFDFCL